MSYRGAKRSRSGETHLLLKPFPNVSTGTIYSLPKSLPPLKSHSLPSNKSFEDDSLTCPRPSYENQLSTISLSQAMPPHEDFQEFEPYLAEPFQAGLFVEPRKHRAKREKGIELRSQQVSESGYRKDDFTLAPPIYRDQGFSVSYRDNDMPPCFNRGGLEQNGKLPARTPEDVQDFVPRYTKQGWNGQQYHDQRAHMMDSRMDEAPRIVPNNHSNSDPNRRFQHTQTLAGREVFTQSSGESSEDRVHTPHGPNQYIRGYPTVPPSNHIRTSQIQDRQREPTSKIHRHSGICPHTLGPRLYASPPTSYSNSKRETVSFFNPAYQNSKPATQHSTRRQTPVRTTLAHRPSPHKSIKKLPVTPRPGVQSLPTVQLDLQVSSLEVQINNPSDLKAHGLTPAFKYIKSLEAEVAYWRGNNATMRYMVNRLAASAEKLCGLGIKVEGNDLVDILEEVDMGYEETWEDEVEVVTEEQEMNTGAVFLSADYEVEDSSLFGSPSSPARLSPPQVHSSSGTPLRNQDRDLSIKDSKREDSSEEPESRSQHADSIPVAVDYREQWEIEVEEELVRHFEEVGNTRVYEEKHESNVEIDLFTSEAVGALSCGTTGLNGRVVEEECDIEMEVQNNSEGEGLFSKMEGDIDMEGSVESEEE